MPAYLPLLFFDQDYGPDEDEDEDEFEEGDEALEDEDAAVPGQVPGQVRPHALHVSSLGT